MKNLFGLTLAELETELAPLPKFRAKQIAAHIYKHGLKTFDAVKNFQLDLTKITVNVEELGLTGITAEKILRHKLKIQCELSDATNLLFLITYADDEKTISKLIDALKKLSACRKKFQSQSIIKLPEQKITIAEKSPREIFFAKSEKVLLKNCVGKISAEEITFYPPGIPIINPGEIITEEIAEYIFEMQKLGIKPTCSKGEEILLKILL